MRAGAGSRGGGGRRREDVRVVESWKGVGMSVNCCWEFLGMCGKEWAREVEGLLGSAEWVLLGFGGMGWKGLGVVWRFLWLLVWACVGWCALVGILGWRRGGAAQVSTRREIEPIHLYLCPPGAGSRIEEGRSGVREQGAWATGGGRGGGGCGGGGAWEWNVVSGERDAKGGWFIVWLVVKFWGGERGAHRLWLR